MVYFIIVLLPVSSSSVSVNADLISGIPFTLGFYLIYSFGSSLMADMSNLRIEKIFRRFYVIFFVNTSGLRNLISLIEKHLSVLKNALVLNLSLSEVLIINQSNNLVSRSKWSFSNYILWVKNWVSYGKIALYQESTYNIYIIGRLIDRIFTTDGNHYRGEIQAYKVSNYSNIGK